MAELAAVAPLLSAPTKEEIIRAAYLVLLADGQITGEEGKKLEDIAEALGIAGLQLGTILDDLAVALATRNR